MIPVAAYIIYLFEDIITSRFNSYTKDTTESEVNLINHDLMFAGRILLYFIVTNLIYYFWLKGSCHYTRVTRQKHLYSLSD